MKITIELTQHDHDYLKLLYNNANQKNKEHLVAQGVENLIFKDVLPEQERVIEYVLNKFQTRQK